MRLAISAFAAAAPLSLLLLAAPPSLRAQTLTLHDVVERAQQDGLSAQAARSARDAARWRDRAFDARLRPQLSLSGTAPRFYRSINPIVQPDGATTFIPQQEMQSSLGLSVTQQIPITGSELFVSSSLSRIDLLGEESTRYWQSTPVVIGLRQELFRPRTLRWDSREQDVRWTIAEREYLEAREDVASRAAAAYFDLYAAELAAANADANAAVNDTLYTLSKGRYEVGKIAENELLQSELALLRARTALDAARLQQERALAALRLQLNVADAAPVAIAPPPAVVFIEVDPTVAVAEALRNQSGMSELELQTLQARRRVTEVRLDNGFNATLTATAGFNQTASVFDDAYRTPLARQELQLLLQMPLVQWGGGRAEVQAALADQQRVASITEVNRKSIEQEAHFAAREFTLAQRQFALSAKGDTVAAKRFEVAKNRYVIGKIDIGDLYIAQSEKDAALQAYVQAVRGYWLAHYRLRKLTLYDFAEARRLALP